MPVAIKVSVTGEERVARAIAGLALPRARAIYTEALRGNAKRTLEKTRDEYLNGRALPVRTGALRGSIEIDLSGAPEHVDVGSALPQAGVLHYGWPAKNIRARPYLEPATVDLLPQYPDDWLEAIDADLRGLR